MAEVRDIFKNKPGWMVIALCVSCGKRWLEAVHARSDLFELKCPACGKQNSFVSFIPTDYVASRTGLPLDGKDPPPPAG
jgi:hypothetical protein